MTHPPACLRSSFVHLHGVGPATERRLWSRGFHTWEDLLAAEAGERAARLQETIARHAAGDWNWFDRALPAGEKWRAYAELGERALYVDIETDGGMDEDCITVIGCFDGTSAHTFVRGRDLDRARELIEDHPLVVTFNGAQFDLPLIRRRFTYNLFNHIHVDLRFPLRRLGLRGGLKAIERQLGLSRSAETEGLGGWDAVRLWREWEAGSADALAILLAYNREDTRNMLPLMRHAFAELSRRLAGDAESERTGT